ncbi:MAG: AmmeMemoRadiSam system radical SAM enzyme [Rhodocyclaceae bacterium]|nr:AmmeMemoRadiSam system radical SAM enzyme [Rhodocyclaceae bacterium]
MSPETILESAHPARHWHRLGDGRLQCDLCPRDCRLADGQRGACFVRMRQGEGMVLTTYGRSSGFCIDPIEKKPLNHFYPGTPVLSFGTAGCNLACKFCQNWDISKSRDMDRLMDRATPQAIARLAAENQCRSVAYTYNDPVIFAEYAIDTAHACRELGIANVAVTAGYIHAGARAEFFEPMDAANVDLKAFSEAFYWKLTGAHLQPVLDTLVWLRTHSQVWIELTTLLIPGANDDDRELAALARWVHEALGPDTPLHFTAFHPDFRLTDRPPTPPATLTRARDIALAAGLHHVYTGNVHDAAGGTTRCTGCGAALIERDWYRILNYRVTDDGRCPDCQTALAGHYTAYRGAFGPRRVPLKPH